MLYSNVFLLNQTKPVSGLDHDLAMKFDEVRQLWENAQDHGALWTESETEDYFVQPILEILAWSFAVQVKIRNVGDVTCPDYTLFRDAMSRALGTSKGERSTDFYNRSLAIAEAKHWGCSLDLRGETQRDSWKAHANPGHQMIGYMKLSGVSWGVLTNGPVWRLYHRPATGHTIDFYEINLGSIFEDFSPDGLPEDDALLRFLIWWRLFHRDAFIPDGTGFTQNARLYENYTQYNSGVQLRLTNRLIDNAIPSIAGGILMHRYHHFAGRQNAKIDVNDLTSVTVNLIYRMLFLFIAEHKGMLMGSEPDQHIHGIYAIANSALDKQQSRQNIYQALLNLFRSLYYGDPEFHLPPYRGELFDPSRPDFTFMAEQSIPDANMQAVFESLTIDGESGVDYECLDGNHLAEIGEVLLDVRLEFTELPHTRRGLVAKSGLRNDGHQQIGSGLMVSTPTIDYLAQQSLHHLMSEKEREFESEMETMVAIRKDYERQIPPETREPLHQQLQEVNNRILETILGLRVLDPSMGTGRCLISVIQYLTNEIICRMQVYHDLHPDIPWDWNPIYMALEQERKRSHARLSRQGLEAQPEAFSDTLLLKRIITQKCVYGVEANPMAVTIAKHNIWLTTFSVGAPFSFLDHHLRYGNAVLGTLLRDDSGTHEQPIRAYLVQGVARILNRIPGATSEMIPGRWNSNTYAFYQSALNTYASLLDTIVLGTLGQPAAIKVLTRYDSNFDALYEELAKQSLITQSQFYHWDLEFPDIYLVKDAFESVTPPGFHAVISIPHTTPIPVENVLWQAYVKKYFPQVETLGNIDWTLFAQGLRLLIPNGTIALVIDGKAYVTRAGPLDQVLKRIIHS